MKMNKFIVSACAVLFSFSIYAADFPEKSLPMTTIISKLVAKGYVDVYKVKYENNAYHVKAKNAQGKYVEANVDPLSGQITESKLASSKLTIMDAAKKVEQEGYHGIYKIEAAGDEYEVNALDKDGKKVSLEVDGNTGKISKDFF